jgi:hydroxyacylglutathione hydrolase
VTGHEPKAARVMAMAEEKRFNPIFRLTSATVIANLCESFPDLAELPDPKTVLMKLRELHN